MLFFHFRINEVTWQGPNIVVMNQVTITPPYTPDNIKGDIHSKAFIHIRKVVSNLDFFFFYSIHFFT